MPVEKMYHPQLISFACPLIFAAFCTITSAPIRICLAYHKKTTINPQLRSPPWHSQRSSIIYCLVKCIMTVLHGWSMEEPFVYWFLSFWRNVRFCILILGIIDTHTFYPNSNTTVLRKFPMEGMQMHSTTKACSEACHIYASTCRNIKKGVSL